jgi:hypothetical protein
MTCTNCGACNDSTAIARRFAASLVPVIFLVLAPLVPVQAQGPAVTVSRIGDPVWELVDFHMFSAPVGPPPNFDGFFSTITTMLMLDGDGNRDPLAPPYDQIWTDALAANRLQDQTEFLTTEADGNDNGVYFVLTMMPDGRNVGSSFDFASGPIIPGSLLPIECGIDLFREGERIGFCDAEYGDSRQFDGESHIPFFSAWPPQLWPTGTPLTGRFELSGTLLDASGAGYALSAPFTVVPEPSSIALCLLGGLGLMIVSKRLRKTPRAMGVTTEPLAPHCR